MRTGSWRTVDASRGGSTNVTVGRPPAVDSASTLESEEEGPARSELQPSLSPTVTQRTWAGLALVLAAAAGTVWFARRRWTIGRVRRNESVDLAGLLRGALARPEAYREVPALFARRVVPVVGSSAMSLDRARSLSHRGRLAVSSHSSEFARRVVAGGLPVIDGSRPEGEAVAATLGAVDLDRWDGILRRSREHPVTDDLERAAARVGENWRVAVAAGLADEVVILDGRLAGRQPGSWWWTAKGTCGASSKIELRIVGPWRCSSSPSVWSSVFRVLPIRKRRLLVRPGDGGRSGAGRGAAVRADDLFAIDVAAELATLCGAQLQGPWQVPAELVRLANARGAARVEINRARGGFEIRCDGVLASADELRDLVEVFGDEVPRLRRQAAISRVETAGLSALLWAAGLPGARLEMKTRSAGWSGRDGGPARSDRARDHRSRRPVRHRPSCSGGAGASSPAERWLGCGRPCDSCRFRSWSVVAPWIVDSTMGCIE